ncbi:MAG: hypothetical protein JXA25_12125 [Anaerolineales bacterium]|nr:hypothetical protein [Anaerolineales bacterium]
MKPTTREERQWLLRNIAAGLNEYLNTTSAPVPVEELLLHPPVVFEQDFGVVDIFTRIWDATFVRPLNKKGSVFVRVDLPPEARSFALARETLLALISGEYGRRLGLHEVLLPFLNESADYFAAELLAPEVLVKSYKAKNGKEEDFAQTFRIPENVASSRWETCVN